MSIWDFIPSVPRPWNPAYRETWDAMSSRERKISFLIDVVIALFVLAFIVGMAGIAS